VTGGEQDGADQAFDEGGASGKVARSLEQTVKGKNT